MKTLALSLGSLTAWAVSGGSVGTIELTADLGHSGRLAYTFSNVLADLLDRHIPTHVAIMRQPAGSTKIARLIDHLALLVAGIATRTRQSTIRSS